MPERDWDAELAKINKLMAKKRAPKRGATSEATSVRPLTRLDKFWIQMRRSKLVWLTAVVIFSVALIVGVVSVLATRDHSFAGSRAEARTVCEDLVTKRLRAPATARFSQLRTTGDNAIGYQISGAVDAQNGFGALIRSTFSCSLMPNPAAEDYTIRAFTLR